MSDERAPSETFGEATCFTLLLMQVYFILFNFGVRDKTATIFRISKNCYNLFDPLTLGG